MAAGALAALVAAATAFAVMSLSKYFEFSTQMGLLAGATMATSEEFNTMEEEALRLGRTLGTFTAVDAANSMKLLAFSGFEVNEILESTEQIMRFAMATQIDLAMATDITARALRTFGIEASDVARVTDVLTLAFSSSATTVEEIGTALSYVGPVAAATGVSLEETTAAIMALANVGIRGSMAGTQLRQVFLRLQAPTSASIAVMKELGLEIFELGPAALSTQRALIASNNELRDLEAQMDSTAAATRELDTAMSKLNISEAKNRLEIMKIRDKAADEGRELTSSELLEIDKLERANDDLAISQQELSIQRQELALVTDAQKLKQEELSTQIEEQTELFNSQKGELKDLVNIMQEFNTVLSGLSDAQKIEALNTLFGIRAMAGFQTLLENTDALETFTKELENAAGTTLEQSKIVEQSAGVSWREFTSSIETFMTEVGKSLAPTIIGLTDAMIALKPAFDSFNIVIGLAIQSYAVFSPLVEGIVWLITTFDKEIKQLATSFGQFMAVFGAFVLVLSSITNPIIQIGILIGLFIALGAYIQRIASESPEFVKAMTKISEIFGEIAEAVGPVLMRLLEDLGHFITDLAYQVGVVLVPFFNALGRVILMLIAVTAPLVEKYKELDEQFGITEKLLKALEFVIGVGIVVAVATLVAGLIVFLAITIGIIEMFVVFIATIDLLIMGFEKLWNILKENKEILELLFNPIKQIQTIFDMLKDADWTAGINGLYYGINLLNTSVETLVENFLNLFSALSNIADISVKIPGFSTIVGSLPGAAKGRMFLEPSITQIAEDGPEVAIPLSQYNGSGGGSGGNMVSTNDTYNITLNVPEGVNGEQLLRQLRDAIEDERTNKRGSVFNTVV